MHAHSLDIKHCNVEIVDNLILNCESCQTSLGVDLGLRGNDGSVALTKAFYLQAQAQAQHRLLLLIHMNAFHY